MQRMAQSRREVTDVCTDAKSSCIVTKCNLQVKTCIQVLLMHRLGAKAAPLPTHAVQIPHHLSKLFGHLAQHQLQVLASPGPQKLPLASLPLLQLSLCLAPSQSCRMIQTFPMQHFSPSCLLQQQLLQRHLLHQLLHQAVHRHLHHNLQQRLH